MDDPHEPIADLDPLPDGVLDRLVYIASSGRSGTSILRDALGIHEEVLESPNSYFLNHTWQYRDTLHNKAYRLLFRASPAYPDPDPLHTLPHEESQRVQAHLKRILHAREFRPMWQLYPLLRVLSDEFDGDPKRIRCWMDKATMGSGLETIAEHFPKARFVFPARDPRGCVTSRARRGVPDRDRNLPHGALVDNAISWRYTMQQILRFRRRHPDVCRIVRFEDFLEDPVGTLEDLHDFLGLTPLGPGVIEERLQSLRYTETQGQETDRGIKSRPKARWKEFLDEEREATVLAVAGETTRKLGYLTASGTFV